MNILEATQRDKNHLVQLCLPIQKAKDKLQFPMLASEKLDGVYGLVVTGREAEDTHIFSRTGEEYVSLNHLKEEFSWLYGATRNQVFIVELYTECVPQSTISGWCRDTKNQHPDVHAYVHDSMSWLQFVHGSTADTYEGRIGHLASCFYNIRYYGQYPHIHLIPQRYITSREQLYEYADIIWKKVVRVLLQDKPTPLIKQEREMPIWLSSSRGFPLTLRWLTLRRAKVNSQVW